MVRGARGVGVTPLLVYAAVGMLLAAALRRTHGTASVRVVAFWPLLPFAAALRDARAWAWLALAYVRASRR